MKSYETPESILDKAVSIPRPILLESAVVGSIGTLIIQIAKYRVQSTTGPK